MKMQPIIIILLVILVIIVVLIVNRLSRVGGAFDEYGNFIEEEDYGQDDYDYDDNIDENYAGALQYRPVTYNENFNDLPNFYKVRADITEMFDGVVNGLDDRAGWESLRLHDWRNMDHIIAEMKEIDRLRFSRAIFIIQTFIYIERCNDDFIFEWELIQLDLLYCLREIDRRNVDDINSPMYLSRDRYAYFKSRPELRQNHDAWERFDMLYRTMNSPKWVRLLDDCINYRPSTGLHTKVAIRRPYNEEDDDETEYRPPSK